MTAEPGPSSKQSVLVVDDDIELLDALEAAFKEAGDLQILALANFDDAKRSLRTEKFDVLITDVRLGAFNGLQLAVVARDTNPGIRVIIFSGFDDPVLRQDAERLGATFLTKPVMSSQLLQLIRDVAGDGGGPPSG